MQRKSETDNLLNNNDNYGATDTIIDMGDRKEFKDLPDDMIQLIIGATPMADIITSFQFVDKRTHRLSLRDRRNKLSFFKVEQDKINDEIEYINNGSSSCRSIASVFGVGIGATALTSLYAHHVETKNNAEAPEKLAAALLVIASIVFILWGIAKLMNNYQIDKKTDSLLNQIEVINHKIRDEASKNKAAGPKV